MGIRDISSKFLATPVGEGAYRDLNGEYHYISQSSNIENNFKLSEFNTEGCHPFGIMKKLTEQLQKMREILGVPITITSGYRNPPVGAVGHDYHISEHWNEPHADGLAVDFVVPTKTYLQVAEVAEQVGFKRIEVIKGSGQNFRELMGNGGHIHVDVYDGSGNTTAGTMYDSPASGGSPAFPWYAYGEVNAGYTSLPTWSELLSVLEKY